MMQAADLCMTSSFLRWVLATGVSMALQYSKWVLIKATYACLSRERGKQGAALASAPSSPWALRIAVSTCEANVRCESRVTPSSLTVLNGFRSSIERTSDHKKKSRSAVHIPLEIGIQQKVSLKVSPLQNSQKSSGATYSDTFF
jgi:hypothetical protein